jgi:hypothetical protein
MKHLSTIAVSGLHRSGTTFVGEILKQAGICVVHEPLNERFGMSGIPIAYPYCETSSDKFVGLLDDAVSLARPWNKDVTYLQAKGIYRQLYKISGGRSGLRWDWLRLRRAMGLSVRQVCIKDPFMSLATPWLVRGYGLSVVCMVRHPAAIHHSTEKQKWRFDVENLLRQPELIARYGRDIPDQHWELARNHAAASIAVLWKLMIRVNTTLAQSDTRLMLVKHEDLCIYPQDVAEAIAVHLGVPFTEKLAQFVADHSEGDRVQAQDNRTHDFKRKSSGIPDAWRGRLDKSDELMMQEIVAEDVIRYYGCW